MPFGVETMRPGSEKSRHILRKTFENFVIRFASGKFLPAVENTIMLLFFRFGFERKGGTEIAYTKLFLNSRRLSHIAVPFLLIDAFLKKGVIMTILGDRRGRKFHFAIKMITDHLGSEGFTSGFVVAFGENYFIKMPICVFVHFLKFVDNGRMVM